eukprot:2247412-Pleurochrysis_carterae.AAC.1
MGFVSIAHMTSHDQSHSHKVLDTIHVEVGIPAVDKLRRSASDSMAGSRTRTASCATWLGSSSTTTKMRAVAGLSERH